MYSCGEAKDQLYFEAQRGGLVAPHVRGMRNELKESGSCGTSFLLASLYAHHFTVTSARVSVFVGDVSNRLSPSLLPEFLSVKGGPSTCNDREGEAYGEPGVCSNRGRGI
jgi:hypothetical protein